MSFEMADNHLMFLVTLPIHYGSNESSETTAISSGTHPHKLLNKPSSKNEHGNIHTTEIKRKTYKNPI